MRKQAQEGQLTVCFAPLLVTKLREDRQALGFCSRICPEPPVQTSHTAAALERPLSVPPQDWILLFTRKTVDFHYASVEARAIDPRHSLGPSFNTSVLKISPAAQKTGVWMKSNCLPPHSLCQEAAVVSLPLRESVNKSKTPRCSMITTEMLDAVACELRGEEK